MIEFYSESAFRLKDQKDHSVWLDKVCRMEGRDLVELCIVFTSDTRLLELNREYRKHDYFTDILTFDYSDESGIAGDIFISLDRVRENAEAFGESFDEEIKRVMVHGVLHLLGYKDEFQKEKNCMRKKENDYIKMFHVEH